MIDQKIQQTIENIRRYGLNNSVHSFKSLYLYILSNVDELKGIQSYQLAGLLFSLITYEKISGLSRAANIAYYCLTRGITEADSSMNFMFSIQNQNNAIIERAKLLLSGGLKLVIDRADIITDIAPQQVVDFAVLGDFLQLESMNFNCTENWWNNAKEDSVWIRKRYSNYWDRDIVNKCNEIHDRIAEQVFIDLEVYAKDFGFKRKIE